ncbi:MAG TPA: hypothetical protein VF215_10410, partial [Thermoanaerobaculia bacterium]
AIPRVTPILASDVEALRAGVNRLRAAAGAAPKSYTTIHANDPIRASEFTALQNDINDARDLLDRPEFDFRTAAVSSPPRSFRNCATPSAPAAN